jgi:hypothetical protein
MATHPEAARNVGSPLSRRGDHHHANATAFTIGVRILFHALVLPTYGDDLRNPLSMRAQTGRSRNAGVTVQYDCGNCRLFYFIETFSGHSSFRAACFAGVPSRCIKGAPCGEARRGRDSAFASAGEGKQGARKENVG